MLGLSILDFAPLRRASGLLLVFALYLRALALLLCHPWIDLASSLLFSLLIYPDSFLLADRLSRLGPSRLLRLVYLSLAGLHLLVGHPLIDRLWVRLAHHFADLFDRLFLPRPSCPRPSCPRPSCLRPSCLLLSCLLVFCLLVFSILFSSPPPASSTVVSQFQRCTAHRYPTDQPMQRL